MTATGIPRPHLVSAGLAAGILVSVAMLIWFGYYAIQEWQRSSELLVERRVDEAADLLLRAFTRDMHAVQQSVLLSPEWDPVTLNSPYDVGHLVASAFARYPYPDSFFVGRGLLTPDRMTFFTRADRPPSWSASAAGPNRFPVMVQNQPGVAAMLMVRIQSDVVARRWFSIFEMSIDGATYQVIARLLYNDDLREHLDGVFGFMVNLPWVRSHYFTRLMVELDRLVPTTPGLALAVVDEQGARLAVSRTLTASGPSSRRPFPLMFFDPLLVAVDDRADVPRRTWAVQVDGGDDPTLRAAINGTNRMLLIAIIAGASVACGLFLTARAVRASADLAELRSEFVSTVTHELKTPIATMRAVADTLSLGRVTSSSGQREYAQIIVQEAKRLTRLVDNLLALSRITDVAEVYSFEPFALDALVDRVLAGFRHQLVVSGFDVGVDIPADLPLLRADRTAMHLLLENLVDNAIRYSTATRWLRIVARAGADGMVSVEVSDKGQGIREDEIDRVTRRFFRGSQAASDGSGLGLAIVKRIVADHGGRLSIRSAVGVGTTVSVAIPLVGGR